MFKNILYGFLKISILSLFVSCQSSLVNAGDSNGNTPLHDAIMKKDISLVAKIVSEKGVDLNRSNNLGITPVMLAASLREKEIVCLLIEKGVDVNYYRENAPGATLPNKENNIVKYPEKENNYFLTFDAGGDPGNLDYILNVLKKYNITSTFFITGQFMSKYPADVKRIAADGHVVGNHTFSHALYYNSEIHLNNELLKTEKLYEEITGEKLTKIWRAPYLGHIGKPWMLASARKIGYRHIDVSLSSIDWVSERDKLYVNNQEFIKLFQTRINFEKRKRLTVNGLNYLKIKSQTTNYNGVIMLMHSGKFRKAENDFVYTLEEVILHLISSGYSFDNFRQFEGFNEPVIVETHW